jgi:hypothetical protein
VLGATGFRFLVRISSSQLAACFWNVVAVSCFTTLLKYSTVSPPLSAMISRARRVRADLDKHPFPETGQILARLCDLSSWPGTTLWPETIRALIIHSAEWTPAMNAYRTQRNSQEHKAAFLRRYGYGVPDLERCLLSSRNDFSLVVEDQLRPYIKEKSRIKTREMNLHRLPWPTDQLLGLGESPVELRVTLSYFIEPNPGERGWTRHHSYASHGLRFEVKRAEETTDAFRSRINKAAELEEQETRGSALGGGGDNWVLGNIRNKGSIHSDHWSGTAAELATRDAIGIFPVGGWWRQYPERERWQSTVRYSLVVSVRAPAAEVDIYTPVMNQIAAQIQTEI